MSGAFEIAGIGLSTQQKALDTIANNIANLNTRSFKRSEVRFSEIMSQSGVGDVPTADLKTESGVAGVSATTVFMLDEQGQLEATGHALDLAIDGPGFIELMGPSGQAYLWRGGSLEIGEDGLLSAGNGMALKNMISVPRDSTSIFIGQDGRILSTSQSEADAVEIGQITLVRPASLSGIERLDGGLYRIEDQGAILDAVPGEDGVGIVTQGSIERSNVDLNNEMVQLMIVQRAYAANAKIVQAADEIMSIANGLRR